MNQNSDYNFKIKLASFLAILVSCILCALKFYACKKINSSALHASAMDSLMDILISCVNLIGIYVITIKKNNLAYYGWDKIASMIALIQAIFMFFVGMDIAYHSIIKFNYPNYLLDHNENIIIYIAIIAFILSFALIMFQRKVIKETNSLIIKSDMIHFTSDLYSNFFICIGFGAMKVFHFYWIDSLLGLFVSLYLLTSIGSLCRTAIFSLLDLNLKKEQRLAIKVLKKAGYDCSEDDLSVRFSGVKFIITVFIDVKNIANIDSIKKHLFNASIFNCGKCDGHGCTHAENALKSSIHFDVVCCVK